MTPEEQRVAIAQKCLNAVEWHDGIPYWKGQWSSVGEGNEHLAEFHPESDLDAMHEAEKVIVQKELLPEYGKHLTKICDAHARRNGYDKIRSWPTTSEADQRAEAFLKTLNLWKE